MRFGVAIGLALAIVPAALRADPPAPDPCRPHGDETACYAAHQSRYLDDFGLPTAESRAAAGDRIRRAMIFDRNWSPVVAIEFRRAAGTEPTVAIYPPRAEGAAGPAEPAYAAAVPLAEWERIGEAGRNFDRALAPVPPDLPPGTILMCADAWLDIVETTDPEAEGPRGRLRRRAEDTCAHGLANAYARALADAAVRLLPACGGIEGWGDFSPRILSVCAMLGGDRMAAAEVYGRLKDLREARDADSLRYYFAQSATLDWAGERIAGAPAIAEAWIRRTSADPPSSFFPHRLVGENAGRVRVEGVLEHWIDAPGHDSALWVAPVSLVLVRSPARTFDITEAHVGDFAPARHYCRGDTLERSCR